MHELAEERSAAREAIERMHLIPVLFELGARPHAPRELYRAYLEQSHIFIGIYAEQYGWVTPGSTISGIEDEYDLAAELPKLIYIREPAPQRDERLTRFITRLSSEGLSYRTFSAPDELLKVVEDDLALVLTERFVARAPDEAAPTPAFKTQRKLPSAATRFIGREGEVRELKALLHDPDVRLLTLAGPGGIGKTRLAFAVAEEAKDSFRDGAAAVLLAPLRSADLVPTSLASALGVPESNARSPIEVVKDYLRDKELLLVIDNFEHVVGAAPVIAELLQESPNVKVIVTTREMLRISGEHVYAVPPLETDAAGTAPTDAMELFLDRARSIHHDLQITEDSLAAIKEISRRLDGLPLAIELAAARVRVLSPQDILARLDSRLQLLTRGASDLPVRQQTLRNAIQWSYDLLTPDEQCLFERLGLFRGGFDLDAAEVVAVGQSYDVLEGLASLMDKSLIRSSASAEEPRFNMLETLREFALERLELRGDVETVRARHACHYLDWVANLDTQQNEAQGIRWMEAENDNVRAALDWSLEHGDPHRVVRAASNYWKFWWVRSLFAEGLALLDKAKQCREPLTPEEDAMLDFVMGMLAFGQGDFERSSEALNAARVRFEDIGDVRGASMAWISIGVVDGVLGRGDREGLMFKAVSHLRSMSDDWGAAFALFGLGRLLLLKGREHQAVPLLEESVARARAAGSETLLAMALVNLGWSILSIPDVPRAKAAIAESLEQAGKMGNLDSMARALEGLAAVALADGDPRRGLDLFGAAEALRRSTGVGVWVPDVPTHGTLAAALRDALGDQVYEQGFESTASLPVEEAVALAYRFETLYAP